MIYWNKNKSVVVVAILCARFASCAAMEAQKRLKEYEGYFEPLVGSH